MPRGWIIFLISEPLMPEVNDVKILPGNQSDHSIVVLGLISHMSQKKKKKKDLSNPGSLIPSDNVYIDFDS